MSTPLTVSIPPQTLPVGTTEFPSAAPYPTNNAGYTLATFDIQLDLASGENTTLTADFNVFVSPDGVNWQLCCGTVIQGSVRHPRTGVAVSGVTNQTNPTITTATAHNLSVGSPIEIDGVIGATGINGLWTVANVINATKFTITASAPGAYVSGGTVYLRNPPFTIICGLQGTTGWQVKVVWGNATATANVVSGSSLTLS